MTNKIIFFIAALTCQSLAGRATWTLYNYIEADNNLARFALYNIREMQKVGSTNDVTILAQLDEPSHKKTWRYKIEKNRTQDVGSLPVDMGLEPEKELADGISWALKNYPSKYFMLTMWDHGNGIVDEAYKPRKKKRKKRGILYDFSNQTFLNNQQLDHALNKALRNSRRKKIDIIGMDACLMAMIEVGYQIKEYANIFIASQNIELAPGWRYANFLNTLTSNPRNLKPVNLAQDIVTNFAHFFHRRFKGYTQSAVYLKKMIPLKDDLKKVLAAFEQCQKLNPQEMKNVALQARERTAEFHRGSYIDLHCFYKNVVRALSRRKRNAQKQNTNLFKRSPAFKKAFARLKRCLKAAMLNIPKAVISNYSGPRYKSVQGISIYFPRGPIHASYPQTKFAIDCPEWLAFIEQYRPMSWKKKILSRKHKKRSQVSKRTPKIS